MTYERVLRAKIHRITVTECDVEYEGSLTLDSGLMALAGMVPYERVEVYDVDNGSRFATYLIEGEKGSGVCAVNGAAARLVEPGHKLILACYCGVPEPDARGHRPTVVLVDGENRPTIVKDREEAGVRVRA
jgi:L-aspartate-alpha-decarboxylase